MNFTGKKVEIIDKNPTYIELDINGYKEKYSVMRPKMVVGNLVMGETFIEA
jgi:hypothetical protein